MSEVISSGGDPRGRRRSADDLRDRHVLVVLHSLSRSGAPLSVLQLLRHVQEVSGVRLSFLALADGPLRAGFEALGPLTVWSARGDRTREGLLQKLPRGAWQLYRYGTRLQLRRLLAGVDIVYSNTVTNGRVLARLAPTDTPVVTHVHELPRFVSYGLDPEELRAGVGDVVIAASEGVKRWVTAAGLATPEQVFVLPSPVDLRELDMTTKKRSLVARPSSEHEPFVVVGSGPLDAPKGFDLFLQLAVALRRRLRGDGQVLLRWVGVEPSSMEYRKARDEVACAGLEQIVDLVPATPDRLEIFASADLLALTSREDTSPLVMLEAAALGVPLVCFAKSGGAPEFAAQGAGVVVPYLEVEAMAEAVIALKGDPERRAQLAARGREIVETAHELPAAADKLHAILRAALAGGQRGCE
jgi:glycosyltransferase involved in cell wall biosynthesis